MGLMLVDGGLTVAGWVAAFGRFENRRRVAGYEFRYRRGSMNRGLAPVAEWLDHRAWAERRPVPKWREILRVGFHLSGDLDRLREATPVGHPFGSKDFVTELETKLERNVEPQKRVREPKFMTNAPAPDRSPADRLLDDFEIGQLGTEFSRTRMRRSGISAPRAGRFLDGDGDLPSSACAPHSLLSKLAALHRWDPCRY